MKDKSVVAFNIRYFVITYVILIALYIYPILCHIALDSSRDIVIEYLNTCIEVVLKLSSEFYVAVVLITGLMIFITKRKYERIPSIVRLIKNVVGIGLAFGCLFVLYTMGEWIQFKNIDELFERVMWYMPVIICVATIIRYLLIKKIDNIVKMYERQEEENNG